jgi:sporulation protein YlmC with PRC-barrel domain
MCAPDRDSSVEPRSCEIVLKAVALPIAGNTHCRATKRRSARENSKQPKEVRKMKKLITTASLVALMAVPALAQDTIAPSPSAVPSRSEATMEKPAAAYKGQLSVNDLINKSVKNGANESVGDINDIRIDADGNIAAVIVGVGGFLGLGEKNVALPYDQLSFMRDSDGALVVTADVTKESLQAAPEWKAPEDRS